MFNKSVTKVVQDCILDSGIQAKDIAERIGKPYSTLMREINPFDTSAKLGAETLLDIMRVTKDLRPLQFMADEMGFSLTVAQHEEGYARPADTYERAEAN